jgi:hypothetical protein
MSAEPTSRRRFGRIPAASEYSALSRATLYELAPKYPGLFRKNGSATIVDFDVLDRVLDALPVAKIKPVIRKPTAGVASWALPRVLRHPQKCKTPVQTGAAFCT